MGDRQAAKEERRIGRLARLYRMAEELGQAALAYTGRFTFERGAPWQADLRFRRAAQILHVLMWEKNGRLPRGEL